VHLLLLGGKGLRRDRGAGGREEKGKPISSLSQLHSVVQRHKKNAPI